jgi:hypothetical protein
MKVDSTQIHSPMGKRGDKLIPEAFGCESVRSRHKSPEQISRLNREFETCDKCVALGVRLVAGIHKSNGRDGFVNDSL